LTNLFQHYTLMTSATWNVTKVPTVSHTVAGVDVDDIGKVPIYAGVCTVQFTLIAWT